MEWKAVSPESATHYVALPPDPGGVASIDGQNVRIERSRVRNVGIAKLAEVVDHRIAAIVDSVSHYVRFCNGGEIYYVFNGRGEIVELSGLAVFVNISPQGDYLFGPAI